VIETGKRKIAKSFTWKIVGFILISLVAYILTGSLRTVGLLACIYHTLMIFMFFTHESFWQRISWGKSKGLFIQMTGLSGAGKTTLARLVQQRMRKRGYQIEVIDGDEYRSNLCSDLGFSKEDRNNNIRRLSFVAKVLARNNVISIISAINPYDGIRKEIKEKHGNVKCVYVKCNLDELKSRDTKGLYRKALLPVGHPDKIENFTGISDPFEEPKNPDLVIETDTEDILDSVIKLEKFIIRSVS
jgi:adenylylsulfate kinase